MEFFAPRVGLVKLLGSFGRYSCFLRSDRLFLDLCVEERKDRRSIQAFNGFVAKLISIVGVLCTQGWSRGLKRAHPYCKANSFFL